MDIPGFADAAIVDALREKRRRLAEDLERAKAGIAAHDAALRAIDGLRHCDRSGFMSNEIVRWFFVASYEAAPPDGGSTPGIARLACVIVPEVVIGQHRHRPVPHADPVQAARGVVTMTPTPVAGAEIARETAAAYASGVRLGAPSDALAVPCPGCGGQAAVVCEHGRDWDSGCQWLNVSRLCPRCPSLVTLAADGWDADARCPLLPPASTPAHR